eukprot:1777497-Rhodomonas_salina.2
MACDGKRWSWETVSSTRPPTFPGLTGRCLTTTAAGAVGCGATSTRRRGAMSPTWTPSSSPRRQSE